MLENIFMVRDMLRMYGFWYCLWLYGVSAKSLWTLFCAHRMTKYEQWYLHDRFAVK